MVCCSFGAAKNRRPRLLRVWVIVLNEKRECRETKRTIKSSYAEESTCYTGLGVVRQKEGPEITKTIEGLNHNICLLQCHEARFPSLPNIPISTCLPSSGNGMPCSTCNPEIETLLETFRKFEHLDDGNESFRSKWDTTEVAHLIRLGPALVPSKVTLDERRCNGQSYKRRSPPLGFFP